MKQTYENKEEILNSFRHDAEKEYSTPPKNAEEARARKLLRQAQNKRLTTGPSCGKGALIDTKA